VNVRDICRILFIDPDADWLDFATGTLKNQGVRAQGITDFGKAERAFRTVSGPQLVLVDLELIEQSLDQFQRLVEDKDRYVVVLSTTDLRPYQMSRIFKLGAYDCVDKPFDAKSLIRLLESLTKEVCPSTLEVISSLAPSLTMAH